MATRARRSKKSPRSYFHNCGNSCGKHTHQSQFVAAGNFWVDPVTFSPSSDKPKMGPPLDTLT